MKTAIAELISAARGQAERLRRASFTGVTSEHDQTIMQAVDDPRPDGLTWDDGIAILRTALASNRAAGLQVAIYNPEIDKDGSNGRGLAVAVRSALA